MFRPAQTGELDLSLTFGVAQPLRVVAPIPAASAADALDEMGRRPAFGVQGHTAPPAQGVIALHQAMTDRDPLVEDETVAAPQAVGRFDLFQIAQDPAFQMVDVLDSLGLQEGGRFLAAN